MLETIVAHALRDAPLECCGLLAGSPGRIVRAYPARNEDASDVSYLVAAKDHFAALRDARARGLDLVGAYHSHPRSAAQPSASDLERAFYLDFAYLIVSLVQPDAPEVHAFRIAEARSWPIELVTVDE